MIGYWSKGPTSRVGAVIVDRDKRIISAGYNGFAKGTDDDSLLKLSREERLRRVIHAEENALLFAQRNLSDCIIYTTHFPCSRCAAKIIQCHITEIVTPQQNPLFEQRWSEDIKASMEMCGQTGVIIRKVFYQYPADCFNGEKE